MVAIQVKSCNGRYGVPLSCMLGQIANDDDSEISRE